tara:strand:+ start:3565 stop:3819 length:255 start_codon:yes stop_codon:yes gene_type:complete
MSRKIYEYKIEQKSHDFSTWIIKSDTKLGRQFVIDTACHHSLFAKKDKPIEVCKGLEFVYKGTEENHELREEKYYGDFNEEENE